jgi:hypothetical protein
MGQAQRHAFCARMLYLHAQQLAVTQHRKKPFGALKKFTVSHHEKTFLLLGRLNRYSTLLEKSRYRPSGYILHQRWNFYFGAVLKACVDTQ